MVQFSPPVWMSLSPTRRHTNQEDAAVVVVGYRGGGDNRGRTGGHGRPMHSSSRRRMRTTSPPHSPATVPETIDGGSDIDENDEKHYDDDDFGIPFVLHHEWISTPVKGGPLSPPWESHRPPRRHPTASTISTRTTRSKTANTRMDADTWHRLLASAMAASATAGMTPQSLDQQHDEVSDGQVSISGKDHTGTVWPGTLWTGHDPSTATKTSSSSSTSSTSLLVASPTPYPNRRGLLNAAWAVSPSAGRVTTNAWCDDDTYDETSNYDLAMSDGYLIEEAELEPIPIIPFHSLCIKNRNEDSEWSTDHEHWRNQYDNDCKGGPTLKLIGGHGATTTLRSSPVRYCSMDSDIDSLEDVGILIDHSQLFYGQALPSYPATVVTLGTSQHDEEEDNDEIENSDNDHELDHTKDQRLRDGTPTNHRHSPCAETILSSLFAMDHFHHRAHSHHDHHRDDDREDDHDPHTERGVISPPNEDDSFRWSPRRGSSGGPYGSPHHMRPCTTVTPPQDHESWNFVPVSQQRPSSVNIPSEIVLLPPPPLPCRKNQSSSIGVTALITTTSMLPPLNWNENDDDDPLDATVHFHLGHGKALPRWPTLASAAGQFYSLLLQVTTVEMIRTNDHSATSVCGGTIEWPLNQRSVVNDPNACPADYHQVLDEMTDLVRRYPEVCQVRYPPPPIVANNFLVKDHEMATLAASDQTVVNNVDCKPQHSSHEKSILPMSMLCCLRPMNPSSSTKILELFQAVYHAFPEAIGKDDSVMGTPLHYACHFRCEIEIVEFLLQRYPDAVRVTNRDHRTPLHLACRCRHDRQDGASRALPTFHGEVLRQLLEQFPTAAGLVDRDGYTPIHYACQGRVDPDILSVLCGVEANHTFIPKSLPKACTIAKTHSVKVLTPISRTECISAPTAVVALSFSSALRMTTSRLEKPLHIACRFRAPFSTIEWLVRSDPLAVRATDDRFDLPLFVAIQAAASVTPSMTPTFPPPPPIGPFLFHCSDLDHAQEDVITDAIRVIELLVCVYPDARLITNNLEETPAQQAQRLGLPMNTVKLLQIPH